MVKRNHPHLPFSSEPSVKQLAVRFNLGDIDLRLLQEAMTHSSYSNEHGVPSYERLEFLGDSILGMVTSKFLYTRYPQSPEGKLSKLKSIMVSAEYLAGFTRELGLDQYILLGEGEEKSGGRAKQNVLADIFEALIGAYFVHHGFKPTEDFILPLLESVLPRIELALNTIDPKSYLQERVQAKGINPEYRVVRDEGPAHERTFTVEVLLQGKPMGRGSGRSIKTAERQAALNCIAHLWQD